MKIFALIFLALLFTGCQDGPKGPQGPQGPEGQQGPEGKGLVLESTIECKGQIEGWMAKSAYSINYSMFKFQTNSCFQSVENTLMRGGDPISIHQASAFSISHDNMTSLDDGVFSYEMKDLKLHLVKKSGEEATIPCVEKK